MIALAAHFAQFAHVGQVRKWTGGTVPYWHHLRNVAATVASVGARDEVVAAAWLHDVLEDTPVTYGQLKDLFGQTVADLVLAVTDVSRPEDGNRAARKAKDRDHLAKAPAEAQTIKLADLIDNTSSILRDNPKFAPVYLAEKRALLKVLTLGDANLLAQAHESAGN